MGDRSLSCSLSLSLLDLSCYFQIGEGSLVADIDGVSNKFLACIICCYTNPKCARNQAHTAWQDAALRDEEALLQTADAWRDAETRGALDESEDSMCSYAALRVELFHVRRTFQTLHNMSSLLNICFNIEPYYIHL